MTATKCGNVAIAGRPNVGKSSLLNALIGQPLAMVSAKAQATRLPTVGLRTEGASQFVFHDLPGLLEPAYLLHHRMLAAATQVLEGTDVILHLHPADAAPAPPFARVSAAAVRPRVPIVVCYTKADLLEPSRRANLGADALIVSAVTGEGIDRLVATLGGFLPEGPWRFPADDIGVQPVRFFVAEYLREAAFELLSDELPYAFAAEVEEFREGADPVYIRAEVFVERESQKKILIGAGGRTIKALGTHARLRLEELLGSRVYLETRVKVLPRWRESPELLSRFGFTHRPAGERR